MRLLFEGSFCSRLYGNRVKAYMNLLQAILLEPLSYLVSAITKQSQRLWKGQQKISFGVIIRRSTEVIAEQGLMLGKRHPNLVK